MRKRKIKIDEIPTFYRFTRIKKQGYLYYLCNKLTDEEKENLLKKYNNIEFFITQSEYAPEQKNNCIMVYDKVKDGKK